MIFGWAGLVWLVVIVLVAGGVFWFRRARAAREDPGIPIAHSERLTALAGYRRVWLRYVLLLGTLVVAAVAILGSSIALTSRPATVQLVSPELHNRDIVLCFDVSGSMIAYDAAVIEVFTELAKEFTGERISLVVFNASAVTYFPLTSDYGYIEAQLQRLAGEFEDDEQSYYDGTLIGNGSSLVGDGLASCVTRFDRQDSLRSRSVILVTDNFVAGEEIFTLPDAAELAAARDVRVYGINPGDSDEKSYLDPLNREFEQAMLATGGAYYPLEDAGVVPAVVSSIESEQAAVLPGSPLVVREEHPELPVIVALFGLVALFIAAWAVRR